MRVLLPAFVACCQRIMASYTAYGIVNESSCDLVGGAGTVVPGVIVKSFPEVVLAGQAAWVEYAASTNIRQSEPAYLSGEYAISCGGHHSGSVHFSLGDTLSDLVIHSRSVALPDYAGNTELVLTDVAKLER